MMLSALNAAGRVAFVEAIGFAYERSPWVAEQAWAARPFAGRDDLLWALRTAVDGAGAERQLELIRAHPDLAGRAAVAGELTAASTDEQASAGLDRLPAVVHARLLRLSASYRRRFGFPFVICVREHTVATIVEQLTRRLDEDPAVEHGAALTEIHKIAALRVGDAPEEETTG